jgi:hypothetical protein
MAGTLQRWLVGEPPPQGAPKLDTLLYLRRIYLRSLLFVLLGYGVFIAAQNVSAVGFVLLAIGLATWSSGLVWVQMQIRRGRKEAASRNPSGLGAAD